MTLTSQNAILTRRALEPFASDVYRIPFAYPYRAEKGPLPRLSPSSCGRVQTHCRAGVGCCGHRRAGTGRRRFIVPPKDYFALLAENLPPAWDSFIAHEVSLALRAPGKWFASEQFGIEPIWSHGQSGSAGACHCRGTGRAEIMDAPGGGSSGGTSGHPLSCLRL